MYHWFGTLGKMVEVLARVAGPTFQVSQTILCIIVMKIQV
jgi:hypothetical protein